MKLVKIHEGLGEFSATAQDGEFIDGLFDFVDREKPAKDTASRMTAFRCAVNSLFPQVHLMENDLGGYTAYRRGLIPHHCTGEGRQIITPVESPLSHIGTAELRLVKSEKGYFATIAFPGYQPKCVDDLADLLCKRIALDIGPLRGVDKIAQDKIEYGLAATPFTEQVREQYRFAKILLDRSEEVLGADVSLLEILKRAKDQQYGPDILSRFYVEREYEGALKKLVDAR